MHVWNGLFNYSAYLDQVSAHDVLFWFQLDPETTAIIPDIMDEYVGIKRMFVSICSRKGSPTLEEVKDLCIDLIQCAFKHIPHITRQEDDIEKAKTFTGLARILCFHLSKWVSYEFFKKVVTHFQPALRSVKQRLMRYEDKLKPLLLQKLKHIAELQSRWVIGTM